MRGPKGKHIWQCEPAWSIVDPDTLAIIGGLSHDPSVASSSNYSSSSSSSSDASTTATTSKRTTADWLARASQQIKLRFYSQFWNLSKPVLFCKFCSLDTAVVEGMSV